MYASRILPVTLLRIQNTQPLTSGGTRAGPVEVSQYRVWQDAPVLVIVSMLSYFCFLEQLLVLKMGSSAIAIFLPFSCIVVHVNDNGDEKICLVLCDYSICTSGSIFTSFLLIA